VLVAQGIYLLRGADGAPGVDNLARTGNVTFIVGPRGVVVVQTGVTYRHGVDILAAVARTTDRPIRLAIITHPQQSYVFGAAAFQERGIPVWMHRQAAALVAERCDLCLRSLRELLGNEATAGTRIIRPDRLLERDEVLDLIGRRLHLIASEWSSAPGALAVYDDASATLITGDSVLIGRVPDLREADMQGWQDLLDRLKATQCKLLVPGHGPIGQCASIDTFAAYLSALDARIALLLKSGLALSDLAGRIDLPEFAQWDEYAAVHSRNAQRLYLMRERQAFDSKP